jgi:hypothetical protein
VKKRWPNWQQRQQQDAHVECIDFASDGNTTLSAALSHIPHIVRVEFVVKTAGENLL